MSYPRPEGGSFPRWTSGVRLNGKDIQKTALTVSQRREPSLHDRRLNDRTWDYSRRSFQNPGQKRTTLPGPSPPRSETDAWPTKSPEALPLRGSETSKRHRRGLFLSEGDTNNTARMERSTHNNSKAGWGNPTFTRWKKGHSELVC